MCPTIGTFRSDPPPPSTPPPPRVSSPVGGDQATRRADGRMRVGNRFGDTRGEKGQKGRWRVWEKDGFRSSTSGIASIGMICVRGNSIGKQCPPSRCPTQAGMSGSPPGTACACVEGGGGSGSHRFTEVGHIRTQRRLRRRHASAPGCTAAHASSTRTQAAWGRMLHLGPKRRYDLQILFLKVRPWDAGPTLSPISTKATSTLLRGSVSVIRSVVTSSTTPC